MNPQQQNAMFANTLGWVAGLFTLYEAFGIQNDTDAARQQGFEVRKNARRTIALIRGDKDPYDGNIYGPIGSSTYDPKKHAEFVKRQFSADEIRQTCLIKAQHREVMVVYALLAVAGYKLLGGPNQAIGNGAGGMLEAPTPFEIGGLLLAGFVAYEIGGGDPRPQRWRRDQSSSNGLDPLGPDGVPLNALP